MKKIIDISKCPVCGSIEMVICNNAVHYYACASCKTCLDWHTGKVLSEKEKEFQFFMATGIKRENAEDDFKNCWFCPDMPDEIKTPLYLLK